MLYIVLKQLEAAHNTEGRGKKLSWITLWKFDVTYQVTVMDDEPVFGL